MARWLLMQPHYLKVLNNDWEYKEVDRGTGKQVRRTFNVPQYLNPADPGDWNYKRNNDDGDIIVTNIPNGGDYPNDIYFVGEPTPDMKPMDEEATVISAAFAKKWNHPIESLAGNYSQSLVDGFQAQMAEAQSKEALNSEGIAKALESIAKTQAMLVELLAQTKVAAEPNLRRA